MSYSDTELMIFIELIWFSITFVLFNSSELFLYELPLLNRSGKALHLSTLCYSFSYFFLLGWQKRLYLWGCHCGDIFVAFYGKSVWRIYYIELNIIWTLLHTDSPRVLPYWGMSRKLSIFCDARCILCIEKTKKLILIYYCEWKKKMVLVLFLIIFC